MVPSWTRTPEAEKERAELIPLPLLERGRSKPKWFSGSRRGRGGQRNRCGWTGRKPGTGAQAGNKWSPRKVLELCGLGQKMPGCWGREKSKVRHPGLGRWVLTQTDPKPEGRGHSRFLLIGLLRGGPANPRRVKSMHHPQNRPSFRTVTVWVENL